MDMDAYTKGRPSQHRMRFFCAETFAQYKVARTLWVCTFEKHRLFDFLPFMAWCSSATAIIKGIPGRFSIPSLSSSQTSVCSELSSRLGRSGKTPSSSSSTSSLDWVVDFLFWFPSLLVWKPQCDLIETERFVALLGLMSRRKVLWFRRCYGSCEV